MCLVHDLAEAQGMNPIYRHTVPLVKAWSYSSVGDITPHEGTSKAEKTRLEAVQIISSVLMTHDH